MLQNMKVRTPFSLAASVFLALASCNEEPPEADAMLPKPETEAPPTPRETEPELPSLFSPISREHEQNMVASEAEAAEIERRIEEGAKVRETEFVKEVEEKLAEFESRFVNQHAEQIQSSVDQYREDLKTNYLASLRQNYDAAQTGGFTVLAEQIAEEGKRVKAGAQVPLPPSNADQANPGMKLLFDLRRWYHDGYRSIEQSRQKSEADLTENYRKTLTEYHAFVSQISPPEAGQKVQDAIKRLDSRWWEATILKPGASARQTDP